MASVERIEQDIAALSQSTDALAAELQKAYGEYLQALAQALRKQLVLSGYQVCTHGYPTQFLALSLNQRQKLQQDLRTLAKQAQATLLSLLHSPYTKSQSANSGEPEDQADDEFGQEADDEMGQITADPAASQDEPIAETGAIAAADDGIQTNDAAAGTLTPIALVGWQDSLEAAIAREMQAVSFQANRLLHQAKILPNKLPEFLRATSNINAEQAEAISQNMMELLMDAHHHGDDTQDNDDNVPEVSMVVQLVAVHLQLAEVEFADGTTTVLRNRLRSLTARLNTLKQTFRKKERELAIACAEDAWRASWFED